MRATLSFLRSAQKSDMNISPSLAAVAGASAVALAVAFVLRPAQLAPRPNPEASAPRENVRIAPAAPERVQLLVYVAGAVAHPGVYALAGDARARDALAKAGGATRDADLVAVNLAAHVADGDEVAVPRQGEARSAPATRSAHRRTSPAARRMRSRPQRGPAMQPIDLNAADASALGGLPGVGPALAERIVEFRALNGPFASVDGLADVAGITPARLDALAPLLTTGK